MAPHTRSSNKNKAAAAASTTNAPTTGAHLTNNQPKGILRRTTTTTTTTSRPAPAQAKEELAAKELDALTGLQMLASGADAHAPRQQELARLETEDPVAHHYAQTVEERAPYALQAAAVLVGMSGGDVSAVAAELAEKKREREEKEEAKRAAGAVVMGAFRAMKAAREGDGVVGMGDGEEEEEGTGEGTPGEEGAGGEEAPPKKRLRFGE